MARLILHPGKPGEKVFKLRDGANTIGRTKHNDVFVLHKSLSREHAQLVLDGNSARVEDLGSKNGTYVDGERVETRELGIAHVIKCGDVVFSFLVGDAKPAAAPAAPLVPVGGAAPSIIYDGSKDPLRRSLDQMLTVGGPPGATALHLQAVNVTERSEEKLQILLKVSELLSSPAAVDEMLEKILELAFEILDVDRGTVVLLEADGKAVPRVSKARRGVPSEQTYSRQIVTTVIDSGVAGLFADARHDDRLRPDGSIIAQSIWAAMCAPLRASDKLLGALYVDNVTRPNRFAQEDLEFLSAFASQAAVAIENATLTTQLAEEAVARNTLTRFFPPTAIEAIVKGQASLAAKETEATALFCDISGYTAMSSTMSPKAVIELLNAYFPPMAAIVFQHEGTLEKYIGDALLAVWGAPFAHPDDPARAVRAAIDMQRAMTELTNTGQLPAGLTIHIGINSGIVAAGNIGTEDYLQYATIGDATNVAARICGVATDGQVVIDERTASRLPAEEFSLEALEPVCVKGKSEPLSLFRVHWD